MAANYGDEDAAGVYGGAIEAQLAQMRINTIANLRKFYAVDDDDTSAENEVGAETQTATPSQMQTLSDAVSGQPISVYIGDNGRGSLAPVQPVGTDFSLDHNGTVGVDEGDPTPLRLRSAPELRDLARSVWNGLVGVADFGLTIGKGALRLYDRNPDGTPNLDSITAPVLDGWRLNYESEPYRNGLGLVGEMMTGSMAPAGIARLSRIRSFGLAVTNEGRILSGAATKSHATEAFWSKNADGALNLEQAVNLADEAGSFGKTGMVDYTVVGPNQVVVDLGDGVHVKYVAVDDTEFVKNVENGREKFAAYRTNDFPPNQAKNGARFTDPFNDGIAIVQVRKSVLESDRALVAVLGHEAFEISGLGVRLRSAGAKLNEIQTYIGQLHVGAVDFADGLVRQMMGKK